jgi:hydroxyjasmonate sulfotransferase
VAPHGLKRFSTLWCIVESIPVDAADHPSNSSSPHECIQYFELQLYTKDRIPDLDKFPDPRLFATHVPFMSLPRTVASSGSKIVYVCRDPKDAFISLLAFVNKFRVMDGRDPLSVEVAVEFFCDGAYMFGPYWDHVLGYWRAHLAHPEKVLFFRYEEMQKDPAAHVRRLAEFAGSPFDDTEESAVVDAIVRLCSFQNMSELEVTKSGTVVSVQGTAQNSSFFRRGVVGDWVNHLAPETARHIDAITEAKFKGSGLIF